MGEVLIYGVGKDPSKMKEEGIAENERNYREP